MRLVTILRVLAAVAVVTSISLFAPLDSARAWLTPLPKSVEAQVDAATHYGLDGVIVYWDDPRGVGHTYAAGWFDRDKKIPAKPDALFKIASISKLYIAAATVQLVADGQLALDASLKSLLPAYSDKIPQSERITLAMLIQHRSGIYNFTDLENYPWDNPPKSNADTLAMILGMPLVFPPGSETRYSNTNYILLGEIIDRTLGYSHHQYIQQRFLNPLGLKDTYHVLADADINRVMSGYHVGYDKDIKRNDFVNPGGSMVATAKDVAVFVRALNDGSLLSNRAQALYGDLYQFGHTGLVPGFQSIARYHPALDAVVVEFVNTSGGNSTLTLGVVYRRIVKILERQAQRG